MSSPSTEAVPQVDIHKIREWVANSLVEDFDATPELAERAALKVDTEHIQEYSNFDDLVEFVHGTESFWDE